MCMVLKPSAISLQLVPSPHSLTHKYLAPFTHQCAVAKTLHERRALHSLPPAILSGHRPRGIFAMMEWRES